MLETEAKDAEVIAEVKIMRWRSERVVQKRKDGAEKNAAHPDSPDSTALAIVGTGSHEPVRIIWIGYRFFRISGGIYKQAGYGVDGIDPASDFGQQLLFEGVSFG